MTNPFALDTPPAPAAAPPANPFGAPGAPVALTNPAGGATVPVPMPTSPAGEDPFAGPAPQQARGPRLRDLYGRLLLIVPHKLEEGVPNRLQAGTTQDRMTADVIVLDGGPIAYGGRPEATPPVPHDKTANVPHKTTRQYISSVGLISQCRDALAKRLRGEPGMVLGRLAVGESKEPGQQGPWLLTPPTEQDKVIARQYLATVDPFA
jgi:hypothetical protein